MMFINGRMHTGAARMIHQGVNAGALTTSYETVIYDGTYATGAPAASAADAINAVPYTDFSVTWKNGQGAGTATLQIYVSNSHDAPTVTPANMDNEGWAQLGSDVVIAANSAEAVQFTGKYKWISIIGKAAGSYSSQSGELFMSNPV